jgi:gluconolactonase
MKRSIVLQGVLLGFALSLFPLAVYAQDNYKPAPESQSLPDVPKGTTTKYTHTSKIFAGTVRDYTVYVPKQYDPSKPACVMIFQDGGGGLQVANVFDNLIHKKEMPVTIAIMIPPGVVPNEKPDALPRYNRSYEYDNLGGNYAQFLLDEILPEVAKKYNLSKNPDDRALCGLSSGGI